MSILVVLLVVSKVLTSTTGTMHLYIENVKLGGCTTSF